MKPVFKSLVVAGLMATTGMAAFAQDAGTPPPAAEHGGMHRMDPAKMEQMMAKHMTELKAKLKITPAQESAWTSFTTAMKPSGHRMEQRPDRAELNKLSTPERIDKMRALRQQRLADMNAAMDKRDDAIKTFYAVLSPEQKKIFDSEHARMGEEHRHDGKPAPAAKP